MKSYSENVYSSSLKLLEPLSLDSTYKTIVEEAIKLVKGDNGSLILKKGNELKRVFSSTPVLYKIKPRKTGYLQTALEENKASILTIPEIERVHPEIKETAFKSSILIPLSYKNERIGILRVYTKTKKFSENDLSVLKFFGPIATLALRKNQLYSEVKIALDTRDLFISLASHELRTPLTTILTYMQLLKRKGEKGENPDPKWIKTLLAETNRLIGLFNELFQLDQIKTGQLTYKFKRNKFLDIVKRAIDSFTTIYPHRKLVFQNQLFNQKGYIYCDHDKILQVILNLLTNATKFSTSKSEINLTVSSEGDFLTLLVSDKGKGIPKAELNKIFEGFYKGKNNRKEGMGLGLFLTKQIIKRHEGQIEVFSKVNKGTDFKIKLPIN